MPIPIKSKAEIETMRKACSIVRDALNMLEDMIAPGVTTGELDSAIVSLLHKRRAKPSFKGYRGFPKNCCVSVNNEVIHGIPGIRKLKNGDIVSIDVGAYIDGFHGDAARSFIVGKGSDEAVRLVDAARMSFFAAVNYAKAGMRLGDLCGSIEDYCAARGYSVVKDFCGHGIGRDLHEEPQIPCYREKKRGPKLWPGMTLAIEPMVCAGNGDVEIMENDWTVITKDGSLSAHYENTVLITDGECEILTL